MAGIDEQLRIREMATAGNPQAAQQKYAQSKDLMDLLVAQKVSNDYASARNAMQAATQTSANPIIDQLDMSNAQVTKNDMMRSLMPGVAIKAGRDQQAMQRQAMGIPTQPAPNPQAMQRRSMGIPSQPAPNIRMADGGIVGYQQGGNVIGYNSRGSVDLLGAALEAEGITDPATINLIRSIYAQESSSGQDAGVSPAGARGGMQVMPATFTEMMGPDANIDDPLTNLRAGSRYAQQMLKQADGDPRLAAAAYYGGPDEIAKLRAGKDTTAPQAGFPSVAEYADQVVNRANDAERGTSRKNTNEADVFNLEAAGIDPDFFASTYREGAVMGDDESRFDVTDNELSPEEAQALDMQRQGDMTIPEFMESIGKGAPTAEERARFEGTGTNPYAFRDMGAGILNKLSSAGEVLARQFGSVGRRRAQQETRRAELATEYPDLNKSQINYLLQGEIGKGQINPEAQAQAQTSGTPLGNRVPSKDARREQVADPFDVKGMVDRLVEPEFRMQGVLDAPQIKGPDKKKGMFDNVDIGRLQAFLAGGGGQTNTASALNEGLKGLMGEDQRRETLASKEAIEAAKIASQRYGVQQDYNAAIAKIGAENRRVLVKAQMDALKAYTGDKERLAREALSDITSGVDEGFNRELMLLQETYAGDPKGLTAKIAALTNLTLGDRMDSVAGATGGSNSGAFEVELPSGD